MNRLSMRDVGAKLNGRAVLHAVTLDIEAGQRVALCGPNGSGKSSLIRVAADLLKPSTGQVLLGGTPIRTLSGPQRARALAYLAQDRRIAWNMPAVEIAALGVPLLERDAGMKCAMQALDDVGAGHLADRGVADMSGGERARVLLARLLATRAPLLLADEPVAGLDPDAQIQILETLRTRSQQGDAVVVSLHDLTLAARWADRVWVMDQGRLIADGPPMQALNQTVLTKTFGLTATWIETSEGPLLNIGRA